MSSIALHGRIKELEREIAELRDAVARLQPTPRKTLTIPKNG